MTKYILVEVHEREISTPELFDSWKEAHNKMTEYFAEVCGYSKEAAMESYLSGEELESNCVLMENAAFAEATHDYWDWSIFEVEL